MCDPQETVFLTFDQATEQYGIPKWRIRKWTWSGRLPSYHPEGPKGRTYIKRSDLLALMEASRKPPDP